MITLQKYDHLGTADFGWLHAHYHFSFANYHHPHWTSHGALMVINDDIIAPQSGFDTHPHRDMEIITYVREGTLTHRDSEGNSGTIEAGCMQVMSAGSGIYHSEYNQASTPANIYQIWIQPKSAGITPQWKTHRLSEAPVKEQLNLVVSNGGEAPLCIHQDAKIYTGKLEAGTTIRQPIKDLAYVLTSKGSISLNDVTAEKGDGVAIRNEQLLHIEALENSEVLLIEVPE